MSFTIKKIKYNNLQNIVSTIFVALFLCIVDYNNVFADDLLYHSTYRSPSLLGRANTGIADPINENGIFYNPAGLAVGKGIYKKSIFLAPAVEVSQSTKNLIRRIAGENSDALNSTLETIGKSNHFSISNFSGIILRRAAIGVFANADLDLLVYKSPNYGGLETVKIDAVQNAGLTFSLAEKLFMDNLFVGVTLKQFIMRSRGGLEVSVADIDQAKEVISEPTKLLGTGSGSGADFGILYNSPKKYNKNYSLGLTIENVANTKIVPTTPTTVDLGLKQTLNFGFKFKVSSRLSFIKLLLDYRDILSNVENDVWKKLFIGTQFDFRTMFGFTAGLYNTYPSLGFYFDLYLTRLDIGFYSHELSDRVGKRPDSRYYFRLSVGL